MDNESSENLPVVKAHVPMVNGMLTPNDLDGLWRLVSIVCKTDIAGDYKDKPEEAFVAVQLGMSVGLNYMQSFNSVAVINGKPSLYGDATTALCQASKELEEHDEYWELDGERFEDYDGPENLTEWPRELKAVVMMKRRGIKQQKVSKFSVGDAIRMGKWNKPTSTGNFSVWQKHPKDMLMWRARHKTQSVVFADHLRGFLPAAVAADIEPIDVTPDKIPAAAEKANDPSPEKANENPPEEKKVVAAEAQFLIDFALEHKLQVAGLEEFVRIIVTEQSTTLAKIIPDIKARSEEFITVFKNWYARTKASQTEEPDSGPSVDDKSVSEPESAENGSQIDPSDDPVALRGILDLALDKYVEDTPEAFIDSDTEANMTRYLEYCSEMIKKPMIEVLQLAKNNPENYCEYFFNWLAAEGVIKKEEEAATEEPDTEIHAPALEGKKEPETPDIIKNATNKSSYTDFVKQFKNMPAPRFKKWVEDSKDALAKADIEDFKEAVRKWEKFRGEGKLKGEWPYPQQQNALAFEDNKTGATNARQRVANLKQTNPGETEEARKVLGFASTVSEEAAKIWEERTHEIIEKKARKAKRGR